MISRKKSLIYSVLGAKATDKIYLSKTVCFSKNKELSKKIKSNVRFHNIHSGERCFILGNGPSLNDVDFSLLSNEYVFTVNYFSYVENYKSVNSNFHVWADPSFFELREDQKYNQADLEENYRRISEVNPICFMPDIAFDYVKRKKLDNILDINYFAMMDSLDSAERRFFDLSKAISSYSCVVQFAISIAVYMGFSEIYLLGCDSTNIVSILNCAMKIENVGMHAYKNDDVNERYNELLRNLSMTDILYDQFYMFEGYKSLKKECDKRNVKLINCSSMTLINEIPRADLSDVLNN